MSANELARAALDEPSPESAQPRALGRYMLYAPIARGGMATIHIARLVGDDGFSRIVAAKRLHPQFTEDPEFIAMFRDEAEIASKIHHPNVVPVLDIVVARGAANAEDGDQGEEVVLVQEYVHGVPLDRLFRAARTVHEPIPPRIAIAVMAGVLAGLHAAHETADEKGRPLGIVHRDVSPQNVMVSVDGIPRLLDFGIAKASSSAHVTRAGLLKGKIAYMAPEQVVGNDLGRSADIYACGVVLWELLSLQRLHAGRGESQILAAVVRGEIPSLTAALEPERTRMPRDRWDLLTRLEPVVARALATDPARRFATAAEMLGALVRVVPAATALEVSTWVKERCGDYLERRQRVLAANEDSWRSLSKIAVTGGTGNSPVSGVSRVRAESGVVAAAGPPANAAPSQIMYISAEPPESRRARVVPWAIAVASLVLSAGLIGALGARRAAPADAPAAQEVPPAAPALPAAAAPAAAPSTPSTEPAAPAPAADATSFLAATPMPSTPKAAPRVTYAPSRRAAVEAPAPHPAPLAVPAVPAPVAPVAAPKADCDPPFYFEGTKKVFKPSCI
ncbi:MAG TPA: serine/threonine-protein kinase [Polyangiaceae bacterium]|jgi:serine/threonine-protein kinase|nr:serine/threonine-protein kinase [Polyangiaceae bacterium]